MSVSLELISFGSTCIMELLVIDGARCRGPGTAVMPNIHTGPSVGERRDSAAAEPFRLPPLGSFVSQLLGNQIGIAGNAEEPHCDHISGGVLFVDIVSSTSMTDLVAASGPDGAELLGGTLSDYFSAVIDVVLAHGG